MKKLLLLSLVLLSHYALADYSLVLEARKKKIDLTEEEKDILEMGEISDARYITGGIVATLPQLGFGIGHAIQGTWSHRGWIFTAGELGSLAVLAAGISDCVDRGGFFDNDCESNFAITAGVLGFIGFRIWEIVDAWAGVPSYRSKYREIKSHVEGGKPKVSFKFAPIVTPQGAGGLALGMNF